MKFPPRKPDGGSFVRFCAGALLAPLVLFSALLIHSCLLPLPRQLTESADVGQRILDRDGQLLARTRASDGVFRAPLSLGDVGPHLVAALLAAEDKRFFSHLGIDSLAILRASGQLVRHGRLVSGASTLTQQLARSTFARPQNLWGKWQEMALALRIERSLSKEQILEQYLSRISFGPHIAGAAAAADHYFGKELRTLSLSEAATLVGLVRGPTLYDPRVRAPLAQRRRDRILERMVHRGWVTEAAVQRARAAEIQLLPRPPLAGSQHWVRQIGRRSGESLARTTLVGPLQREVETLVAKHAAELQEQSARAASVVVLDNHTGEVLSWVGSPDFNAARDGQNDGVLALRQPGSTLKPFLYAMGIEQLGLTTASFLPDDPVQFRTADTFYEPRNFDRTFRGRVRLSRALANSLNVPAVHLIAQLGVGTALTRLREMGLTSLDRDAAHYGPALALGDGEVSLLALTAAYAMLARGGTTVEPQYLVGAEPPAPRRVLSPEACALVTEILSDDAARREVFGGQSALDLPFAVAAKTGTSKGYRDGWTVGYTRAITVGVWVGNFDGTPTDRITGARGAGPLFHHVMQAAAQELGPRVTEPGNTRPLHDVALERAPVCADREASGLTADCEPGERQVLYWFTREQILGRGSDHSPPAAPRSSTEPVRGPPQIAFPKDGMVFDFDPAIPPERQRLILRATPSDQPITLLLNEEPLGTSTGSAEWILRRGRFRLVALAGSLERSAPVEFLVR